MRDPLPLDCRRAALVHCDADALYLLLRQTLVRMWFSGVRVWQGVATGTPTKLPRCPVLEGSGHAPIIDQRRIRHHAIGAGKLRAEAAAGLEGVTEDDRCLMQSDPEQIKTRTNVPRYPIPR